MNDLNTPVAAKVFVAGCDTLLGEAIVRRLRCEERLHVLDEQQTSVDLADATPIERFMHEWRPDYVVHAAGDSGGIAYNQRRPATLAHDNVTVLSPLLRAAQRVGVRRLIYLASSCCYPRDCPQPMRVEHLWTGPFESTNLAYASAKLMGVSLCLAYREQFGVDFVAAIPANTFGRADHFDSQQGHVVPALIARMHAAKLNDARSLTIWGSGTASREFLHADDIGDAVLHVIFARSCPSIINLAGGTAVTIAELVSEIADVVGYRGEITFDRSRPDGMPRKLLDAAPLAALGWRPRYGLREALRRTYDHYCQSVITRELVDVR